MSFSRISRVNAEIDEVSAWNLARIALKLFSFQPLGSEGEGS